MILKCLNFRGIKLALYIRIRIMSVKNLPIYGNVSEFGGMISETININTAMDNSTVISRDTFSPDSGGKMNPSKAMEDISMLGNIRLRT